METDNGNNCTPRNINDNFCQFLEFFLIKENNAYKFIVGNLKDSILIKCKHYELLLNNTDLSTLIKKEINTIDEAYEYIVKIFDYNKVIIKEIKVNISIKLMLRIYNKNDEKNEKNIELELRYNNENYSIINDLNYYYNKINDEINNLKDKIMLLNEEINIIKNNKIQKINDEENEINKTNNKANDLEFFCDITNDSYSNLYFSNSFSVFNSLNQILYLIYSNKKNSIIHYNLNDNKIIKEIKNAHKKCITNFRHYLDNLNKRDLIMSISSEDNNIKIWDIEDDEDCLLNIRYINNNGYLYSACFLNEKNINYIITSNYTFNNNPENIKVYDFNGKKIKEINNSNEITYYIDSFYDNKLLKNYILTCNEGFIKSYDCNKNDVYKKYTDDNNNTGHFNLIINENKDIFQILESSFDGNIRIWNFHTGELLNRIKISDECIKEICMWNNEYILAACDDKTIKIIQLDNGIIIKELKGHKNYVISIKQIIHPIYGQCLISQGFFKDNIKLWTNKNYIKSI